MPGHLGMIDAEEKSVASHYIVYLSDCVNDFSLLIKFSPHKAIYLKKGAFIENKGENT